MDFAPQISSSKEFVPPKRFGPSRDTYHWLS
jgi:hypothetical protein